MTADTDTLRGARGIETRPYAPRAPRSDPSPWADARPQPRYTYDDEDEA